MESVDFCAQFPEKYYEGCHAITRRGRVCRNNNGGKMYCSVHQYLEPQALGDSQNKSVRMSQVLMLLNFLTIDELSEVKANLEK